MKEIYNLCNPRGTCKCPKVYELNQEEVTTVFKNVVEGNNLATKIGRITIIFNREYPFIIKGYLYFSALSMLLVTAIKTDLFGKVSKGTYLHITDEEKPKFAVFFKK